MDYTDVNKILVFKEEPYGSKNSFKYFIGYNDDDAIRTLCIKLPQMIEQRLLRTIPFKISDSKLLRN